MEIIVELNLDHETNIKNVEEFERDKETEKLRIYTLNETFVSIGSNQFKPRNCPHDVRKRKGPGKAIGITPSTMFFDATGSDMLSEVILPRMLRHFNVPLYRQGVRGRGKREQAEFFKKRLCSSILMPGEIGFHEQKLVSIFNLTKKKDQPYIRAYLQLDDSYKELEAYANEPGDSVSLETAAGRKIEAHEVVEVIEGVIEEFGMPPATIQEWEVFDNK